MNESVQTTYLQGRSRALGPFRDSGEGTEKKWFTTICPSFGKGNSLSRRRYSAVHRGSSFWRVKPFTQEDDDGEESVVVALSVRGPPSLGLRARTKYVAQVNGFVWGVPHTYESTAVGR